MKKVLFFLFLLASFSITAQVKSNLKWYHSYKSVLKKAKRNKKPVLVYFSGSDWCAPCKRLKEDLFDVESFSKLSKKYNLLYVDIPQKQDVISERQYSHNKELMYKLNPRKIFPTVLVLNKRGKIIEKKSGYNSKEEAKGYLDMMYRYIN